MEKELKKMEYEKNIFKGELGKRLFFINICRDIIRQAEHVGISKDDIIDFIYFDIRREMILSLADIDYIDEKRKEYILKNYL